MKYFKSDNTTIKDCIIGSGTKVWHYSNLYGCQVGLNCTIGSHVEIQNDVIIGDNVTIGAGSLVIRDVESDRLVYGVPTHKEII